MRTIHPSNARGERRVGVAAGIPKATRMMGGGAGEHSTHPSKAGPKRWAEVMASKAYPHRT